MIYLLWPTVRPEVMIKRHRQWLKDAENPNNVEIRVAVNTDSQAKVLKDAGYKYVIVCGNKERGVAPASYALSSRLNAKGRDIVILASDDFFAPKKWDKWLIDQFKNYDGGLLVNDGYQNGGCVTLPIMTYKCLSKLNHIIYHPVYGHLWSDTELYNNLISLKMLKNLRKSSPLFEHRHWANGKRNYDTNDREANANAHNSNQSYDKRMKLKIGERLKISPKWEKYAKEAYLAQEKTNG